MSDLFDYSMQKSLATEAPLAARMREFVGEAVERRKLYNLRTILFVDEVLEVLLVKFNDLIVIK